MKVSYNWAGRIESGKQKCAPLSKVAPKMGEFYDMHNIPQVGKNKCLLIYVSLKLVKLIYGF